MPCHTLPPVRARVHLTRTAKGPLQTVIIVDPAKVRFRRYRPPLPHDEALRRALRSAGLDAALVQCALPLPEPHTSPHDSPDMSQSRDRPDGTKA